MAERTNFPTSPACGAWETLLADALDGLLKPEDEGKFAAHKADCVACAALYEEARKGREWLRFLSPEPEVPAGLLDKILAKTGPGHAAGTDWSGLPIPAGAGAGVVPAFVPPVWQQPGFLARTRQAMQPRLLMTAAMAFFSIALTLNITGARLPNVRVTALRMSDMRPRAMRAYMERQLTMASVPIVRYYDHLRFVYEVESRVRELRGEAEDEGGQQRKEEQPRPGETRQNKDRKDGGWRADPQQQPSNSQMGPAMEPAIEESNDLLESSLELNVPAGDGTALRAVERDTVWSA
jgi:hypothetical protein